MMIRKYYTSSITHVARTAALGHYSYPRNAPPARRGVSDSRNFPPSPAPRAKSVVSSARVVGSASSSPGSSP